MCLTQASGQREWIVCIDISKTQKFKEIYIYFSNIFMEIKNQRLLVSICIRSSSFTLEDKEGLPLPDPPFSFVLCPTQWGNKLRRF